jgi:hypothetical protein
MEYGRRLIQTRQPQNISGLPDSHCPEKLNFFQFLKSKTKLAKINKRGICHLLLTCFLQHELHL